MKLILAILISLNICFAQTIQPITKGESAPKSGYLVDKKFAELATSNDKEVRLLRAKTASLKDLQVTQEEQVSLYKKRAEKAETRGDLKGIGGFLLGVLATGLASYVAIKVSER